MRKDNYCSAELLTSAIDRSSMSQSGQQVTEKTLENFAAEKKV